MIRIDQDGKVSLALNAKNEGGFLPQSIATRFVSATSSSRYFVVGNLMNSPGESQGAIFAFTDVGFQDSYTYGAKQTRFHNVMVTGTKSLTVVGSSSDLLAERAVVGKTDGIIMTISQANGKVSKIVRSSGKGAVRSWDSVSGNLLVAGTSRVGKVIEGVVSSFTPKGAVSWTTRFPQAIKTLASGNCIATASTTPEVFIYQVNTQGKQVKLARIPREDLLAVATTPTKGCAVLTTASAGGIGVSYL